MSNQVGVFLSYLAEEESIASVIRNELIGFSERVEVFQADVSLQAGKRWKEGIRDAIEKSKWLIMVYTDPSKDWEWPIYEATTFESLHGAEENGDHRLCCLHDREERPKTFSDYQSYMAETFIPDPVDINDERMDENKERNFYKKSPIYTFLVKFLSYPENNPLRTDLGTLEGKILESTRNVCQAFFQNRQNSKIDEKFYPARIEISLPQSEAKQKRV